MQPVEDIVDLLAFYLGVDAMSEKLIAGLKNTGASEPTRRGKSKKALTSPELTSVLTCMTPSSVRVLVSITVTASAERSAKIF